MIQILDNESMNPIFEGAHIMRVDVEDEKKATRFEVESGAVKSDHIIDKLVEMDIDLVLVGEKSVMQFGEIEEYYTERKPVTVQTRMRVYLDMVIERIPNSQSADIFEGALVNLHLVEWQEIQPEYGELKQEQVASPEHTSTQQRGKQSCSEPTEPEKEKGSSILYRLAS